MYNDPIKINPTAFNRVIYKDSIFSTSKEAQWLTETFPFPTLSCEAIIEERYYGCADVIRLFTDKDIEYYEREYEYIDINEQLQKEISLNDFR